MKNYSKHDFDYVVGSITGFTDQVGGELVTKALMGATTVKEISQRVGIRGTQTLNLLDSTPVFSAGSCGWNAQGSTTYTQRNITVCPEKAQFEWCSDDLRDTYLSMFLNGGDLEINQSAPFESEVAANIVKHVQQRVESKIWNATVAGGDCYDGLKTLIAAGEAGVANTSGATWNPAAAYGAANPIYEVDKLINALSSDAQALESLKVFCSVSNFRKYVQALTQANYFQNYIAGAQSVGSISNSFAMHPNANVKVVPTLAITDDYVAILPAELTFFGTNLIDDSDKIDVFYSKDFDVLKGMAKFSHGVQIAKFGSTIYYATNGL